MNTAEQYAAERFTPAVGVTVESLQAQEREAYRIWGLRPGSDVALQAWVIAKKQLRAALPPEPQTEQAPPPPVTHIRPVIELF